MGFSKIASNLILFDSSHQNKKLVLGTRTRFLALTKLPKQCLIIIIYRNSLELSFCLPTCVVSSLKKFPWDYLWCGGNHAHPSLMGRLSGPLRVHSLRHVQLIRSMAKNGHQVIFLAPNSQGFLVNCGRLQHTVVFYNVNQCDIIREVILGTAPSSI